jgi:uncharacterized phiE125 gp8 family phage protein
VAQRVKQTVAPASEPVSLTDAKAHLRVDIDDDDDFISGLIAAARQYTETTTRRAFISQTWRLSLDNWPAGDEIELPKPPLASVSSIVYKDADGASTTWATSNYIVDTDSEPGRIVLANGASWPTVSLYPVNPIQITFVAGYGAAGSSVPQYLRQAVKLLVSHWYENPEATKEGSALQEIPFGVESLIYLNRAY